MKLQIRGFNSNSPTEHQQPYDALTFNLLPIVPGLGVYMFNNYIKLSSAFPMLKYLCFLLKNSSR